jgi:hypothetical protein
LLRYLLSCKDVTDAGTFRTGSYLEGDHSYNLAVEWMFNGGRGPLNVPGEVTWAYGDNPGPVYFVVLKDKKLVRAYRGFRLSFSCD